MAIPSVATVVAPHCNLNETVPEERLDQVRVVVLPAVNSEPVPGVMKALSEVVEVCAAESERVARRPNATVKKRILVVVFSLSEDSC